MRAWILDACFHGVQLIYPVRRRRVLHNSDLLVLSRSDVHVTGFPRPSYHLSPKLRFSHCLILRCMLPFAICPNQRAVKRFLVRLLLCLYETIADGLLWRAETSKAY
jgi:hypothetical protein